ncbi:MAG: IgGFc-binding protein [Paludibacteraceae bacterium]|nr:IgGFc-binding protein [Paludibacteraceae bacterium]
MKRMKSSFFKTVCLVLGCWCFVAGTAAQSSTREWTTKGNDFWGVFMDNSNAPSDAVSLTFTIYIVADTAVDVTVDIMGMPSVRKRITSLTGGMDSIVFNVNDGLNPQSVYISGNSGNNETERALPRSFHIHNTSADDSRVYSCYAFNKFGEPGYIAQDASLLIPRPTYGKEYVVQTYVDDTKSTEFVVVATEDNTNVRITPAAPTLGGTAAGGATSRTLMRGQSIMVASVPSGARSIDMSGSFICADKPIAVYSGNQAPKIPFGDAYSAGYAFEQVMPIEKGNTDFYLGLPGNGIVESHYNFVALYSNTHVQVLSNVDGELIEENYTLANSGDGMGDVGMMLRSDEMMLTDVMIHSDKPIMCTQYMTSGAANSERIRIGTKIQTINWGNPADARAAGWDSRVKSVRVVTKELTPKKTSSGWEPYQKHLVHLIVKTSEIGLLTIVGKNGPVTIDPTAFSPFLGDPSMSYGSILLSESSESSWFDISTSGDGFVGFVYGITDGIGYQYTLDFNPYLDGDSLYIQNPEQVMSPYSYDLPYRENDGWYQRQLADWLSKKDVRLDTAYICDSTTLKFYGKLHKEWNLDSVVWKVYECDEKGRVLTNKLVAREASTDIESLDQFFEHRFVNDPQLDRFPQDRDPYTLYQTDLLLYRKHILCENTLPVYSDTLRTMVHVFRSYNDTIRRMACITDTMYCFVDDATHTDPRAEKMDSTMFVSKDGSISGDYQLGFELGLNQWTRHYTTIADCDSTVTFELYVCDTVHIILDTTVCVNELLRFPGSLYFQDETFDHEGRYLDTIKTIGCNDMKARYDTANAFIGCDSIFEVNLHICDTFMIFKRDTFCSNGQWDLPYQWRRDGRLNPDSLVREMYFTDDDTCKWFEFRDTVKTISCPSCDQGGCDSIFVLNLYIATFYHQERSYTDCGQFYNPTTGSLELIPYTWDDCTSETVWDSNNNCRIPTADIAKTTPGIANVFVDSLVSHSGCDSITTLTIMRHKAYLNKQLHSMADNETFEWRGRVFGPLEEHPEPYIYHDSLESVEGCDSIYRLEITIGHTFIQTIEGEICADGVYTWTNHTSSDKYDLSSPEPRLLWDATNNRHIWSNQLSSEYFTAGDYTIIDSLRMAIVVDDKPIETDSIWVLSLMVHPLYATTDNIHMCDNDTLTWQGTLYVGSQFSGTPAQPTYTIVSKGVYTNTAAYTSVFGCDSVFDLNLTVYRTFYQEEDSTVCQGDPFAWTLHEGHAFVDEDGDPIQIEHITDEWGEYVLYDTLHNAECADCEPTGLGCDSIYRLHVTVNPSYKDERTVIVKDTICSKDAPYVWTGHDAAKFTFSADTTINDTIATVLGCDSVVTLQLHVVDNADKVRDTVVCQNEPFFFFGVQRHPFSPKDSLPGTYTYEQVIDAEYGCEFSEKLTILLNPSYYQEYSDTICQDTVGGTYEWVGHNPARFAALPINQAGTFTYYDSLLTVNGCDCDSVWLLRLTVLPSYYTDSMAVMSEEQTFTWEGVTYGGVLATTPHDITVTKDTTIELHWDTYVAGSNRHCDSTRVLYLRIGEVFRDTLRAVTCGNEDYTWYGVDSEGATFVRRVIPFDEWSGQTLYTTADPYQTVRGFDSIYNLELTILPYYPVAPERTHVDSVCQGNAYEWLDHPRALYRTDTREWITTLTDYVPALACGTYIFYDSIGTVGAHSCDSVWALQLRVDSVYNQTAEYTICENDTLHWENRLYVGQYFEGTYDEADYHHVFTNLPAQEAFTDDTVHQTIHGCDSTWNLVLHIRPSYPAVAATDTVYFHVCDTELHTEGDITIGRQVVVDTIATALGCDSAVAQVTYIHPTYLIQKYDTVCRDTINTTWEWQYREGRLVYNQQHEQVDPATLPIPVAGNYVYVDSTRTRTCAECGAIGGCDSVMVMNLCVLPSYYFERTDTMSDEAFIKWEGKTYVGANCSYTPAPDEQVVTVKEPYSTYTVSYPTLPVGTHTCDSTLVLNIRLGKVYRDTTFDFVCDNCVYEWKAPTQDGGTRSRYFAGKDIPGEFLFKDDSLKTIYGFDSIFSLQLYRMPTYAYQFQDTVCQSSPYEWAEHEHHIIFDILRNKRVTTIATDESGWFTFIDSLQTQTYFTDPHVQHSRTTLCDSVWTLTLYVPPTYRVPESLAVCDNDTLRWQNRLYVGNYFNDSTLLNQMVADNQIDTFIVWSKGAHEDSVHYFSQFGCDSVCVLNLDVRGINRTYLHHVLGDNNTTWSFCPSGEWGKEACRKGEDFHVLDYTDPTRPDRHFMFIDTVPNQLGCDSIVYDSVDVYPSYRYDMYDNTCSNVTYNWRKYTDLNHRSSGIYYDSLKTVVHGVDSIYVLHLTVVPSLETHESFTMCKNDTVVWYDQKIYYNPSSIGNVQHFTATYETEYGCNGLHYLDVTFCQNYDFYTVDTICVGDSLLWRGKWYHTAGEYADSLRTSTCPTCDTGIGCDSVYHLTLRNYPTYAFYETDTVCRDTVNSTYTWINQHGDEVLLDEPILINQSGTFHFHKGYETIQQTCDSSYFLELVVLPTYEFDSMAVICDNESIVYQGKTYVGSKAGGEWAAGAYTDTVRFETVFGCDSIYIFGLVVYPSYDAVETYDTICDNETFDFHGHIYNANGEWVSPTREVQTFTLDSVVASVHGCDSAVLHKVTVYPTWRFLQTDTVCQDTLTAQYTWTNPFGDILIPDEGPAMQDVVGDYTYTKSFASRANRCDSLFELQLTVLPVYRFEEQRTMCDNEMISWQGHDYRGAKKEGTYSAGVWHDTITYATTSVSGYGCDSTYILTLTVYPTYEPTPENFDICDSETYDFHGHIYNARGEWVSPTHQTAVFTLDTVLTSVLGCDSAVQHIVTVHPTYRFVCDTTICSNETLVWHDRSYHYDKATVAHDSIKLQTANWGCDSIYCLNLTVQQAYAFQIDSVICADQSFTFTWHNTVKDITVVPNTKQSFSFYDSLTTRYTLCDSVYHLDLTVCAFQYDTIRDTLCTGDTYVFRDSAWTRGGTYHYEALNQFNCPEITTLYLTEIPPTRLQVKALNVCADASQVKVAFTFSGKRPRSYRVDYSTAAEQHGFVDADHLPVTDDTLYLDMPYRADRLDYVRPDNYSAKLYFEGVCIDSSLTSQNISFTVHYPSWIIPQHWDDVIQTLAPAYNGGYEFSGYQWYKNNEQLIGETGPYYYNPHYLDTEAHYSVALRRSGEDYYICSCEMTPSITKDDPVMPTTPYVSVVPTEVVRENPVVNILSVSGGQYELYDIYGSLFTKGSYDNLDHNAFQVRIPSVPGTYVFRLYDRGAGEREVKVIVH